LISTYILLIPGADTKSAKVSGAYRRWGVRALLSVYLPPDSSVPAFRFRGQTTQRSPTVRGNGSEEQGQESGDVELGGPAQRPARRRAAHKETCCMPWASCPRTRLCGQACLPSAGATSGGPYVACTSHVPLMALAQIVVVMTVIKVDVCSLGVCQAL
jgi:hypothetical protein